ncbi:MAG: T9SS type A sorting domain-containing protein [Bacteroidota bacterium]|nr:T9SS type A sorting domain-containing protein [Bacteroidota bacterium]
MKKLLLFSFVLFFSFQGFAQLLSWTPDFATESTNPFTITMDANYGNKGLLNHTASDVYVHIGLITNYSTSSSNWLHVQTTWGTTSASAQATSLGNNKWSFTISGGLRTYFGLTDPNEKIEKIAILFRSGDGNTKQANADGSDMFIPVYNSALALRVTDPFFQPTYTPIPESINKSLNDNITITAKSNSNATLTLLLNGTVIQTATNTQNITAAPTLTTTGSQQIIAKADNGSITLSDTLNFYVNSSVNVAALPAGVQTGINYGADNKSVTLVLFAPGKSRVAVIGDFAGSNWKEQSQYELNKTPDGNYWWITITGLTPAKEYSYQFLVDGQLKIADPYAEKILDPVNDPYISSSTYPGLKPYPTDSTTGIVSVLQTAQTPYNWQVTNFSRPDKRNLVIYELWLTDFVANHDWTTLADSLNYFKKLGINAIEVMPFNEFEGNISWGYNPDFYFAPDKYYGTENSLKQFIDECHQNGIAVIMDMVLNHSFGSSPMVQLYWDSTNNRPAVNNPWFNPVAKHAYNVGYDMNHESAATHYFVSRVVNHWLNDYKIDGFRFDLSKGFTQTQTCDTNGNNCNVSAWGNYDSSRVKIWKGYYDTLQLKSPGSYAILEHFADNSEEKDLSNYGMLLWSNMAYPYEQASMGYNGGSDFSSGIASVAGWSHPYKVTYMESHDEERVMYKDITYGNSSGSYNIKDTATALKRQQLTAAFLFMLPGPKMLWEFGELGYDYPINYCGDGSVNNSCRTDPKPLRWDYYEQPNRKKLFDVYSALIKLRFNPSFSDQFISNFSSQSLNGNFKWITMSKIVVVGNFDVVPQTGTVTFPSTGTWKDYLNDTTISVTNASQNFTLQPGEFHVFAKTETPASGTVINFSGSKQNNENVLNWQISSQVNLVHFELQRSVDGQNFTLLSDVPVTGSLNYSYTDNDTGGGSATEYYRLKTLNSDSSVVYSNIVIIKSDINTWRALVMPNPMQNVLNLKIESPADDKATIIITDISGRQLVKKQISIAAGVNLFPVVESENFANGTYFISIFSLQKTQNIKLVKNK